MTLRTTGLVVATAGLCLGLAGCDAFTSETPDATPEASDGTQGPAAVDHDVDALTKAGYEVSPVTTSGVDRSGPEPLEVLEVRGNGISGPPVYLYVFETAHAAHQAAQTTPTGVERRVQGETFLLGDGANMVATQTSR